MKCFTVNSSYVTPSIAVTATPFGHIGIGEDGRGRRYNRVPLGKQDFPEANLPKIIDRASVIKTKERGTVLVIREKPGDDKRALVLVQIPAGYRGGTTWTGVTSVKTPCKKRGQSVYQTECPSCGIKLEYGATHPDEGMAYDWPTFPSEGVIVVAEGSCAQGCAAHGWSRRAAPHHGAGVQFPRVASGAPLRCALEVVRDLDRHQPEARQLRGTVSGVERRGTGS